MSPLVRPAGDADIAPVVDLLHNHMNARIPRQRWRLLLDYPWRPDEVERGWVVSDGGRVVGFMGTVYSDRSIDGVPHRFCDLSSWYLLRDYRASGVGDGLLRAGMARPEVTYQTMTARRATGRKIRALGFTVLDGTRSVFRPRRPSKDRLAILREREAVRGRLSGAEAAAFDAHRGFDLRHVYVEDLDLWICYQRKLKGAHVAYHEVMHASDRAVLSANAQAIADAVIEDGNGILAVDSRFMTAGDATGEIEPLTLPRWFRSPHVAGPKVDHLYSEVILLDQKLP